MFALMYWDQWNGKPGVVLHSNRGIPTEGRSVVLKVQRDKREKTRRALFRAIHWQGQVLDRRSWGGDGCEALRGLAGLRCGGLCRTQLARFRDQVLLPSMLG